MSKRVFVEHLPDLIKPDEYEDDPLGRRVRIRIRASGGGLEILCDGQRPKALDDLLEGLSPDVIEQVLCG